jgi:hypothetical protein
MLYRCVLVADWLRRETVGEWWVRVGSGRAERAAASARGRNEK